MGEYLENAQTVPLLNTKMVDTERMMRALEALYASIPEEIKKSEEILSTQKETEAKLDQQSKEMLDKAAAECAKVLGEAKTEAERILNQDRLKEMVEEEAKRIKKEVLVEIEEMRQDSLNQARELQKKAILESQKIKEEAESYAEQIFRHLDLNLAELQVAAKNGRRFLADLKEKDLLEVAS